MALLFEVVVQLAFELLGEGAEHPLSRRRPTNRWVAYVGCIALGSLIERAASKFAPRERELPDRAESLCGPGSRPYLRREPEQGVLHRLLRDYLETFLRRPARVATVTARPRYLVSGPPC